MTGLTRSSFGLRQVPTAVVPTLARTASGASAVKIEANSSASQHKTFDACRRKWAFEKVWGVKDRERHHFVFGHVLHSVAERYILGKTTSWEELFPKAWNAGLDEYESNQIRTMASKAVERGVWQAVPDSYIEFPLAFLVGPEFVDARGLPLLAKADTYHDEHGVRRIAQLTSLYDGRPLPPGWNVLPPYVGFIDHMILAATPPTISDHKTSKNRKYATTPGKLAEDLQVLSYAAVPMAIRPEVDLVQLRHNLFLKDDSAEPYVVPAVAPFDKVRATWNHIRANAVDMLRIRQDAPKVVDASNPYARANNWQRVKSAIEEGRTKDACETYGGCPFKDICFGRATAEQVIRRLDSPDPQTIVRAPEPTFGLRGRPAPTPSQPYNAPSRFAPKLTTTPTIPWPTLPDGKPDLSPLFPNTQPPAPRRSQELSMPFASPARALAVGQDVYIVDPENAALQYRARVLTLTDQEAGLALYPNPDIAPVFDTLGASYRVLIPKETVLTLPHVTAKVRGYQDTLKEMGQTENSDWTAATAPTTAPALAVTDKPTTKPPRDGAFGLKGAPVTTPVPVAEALPAGTPAWALHGIANGTVLTVKPTTHTYWSKYVGKQATVAGTEPGDIEGSTNIHVVIEEHPHPAVNAHRFELATIRPEVALVGQVVVLTLKSTFSAYNCVLEGANADGVTYLNGRKAPWSDVKSLVIMGEGQIPGAPPTPEQKAAAKAAAKAEKAAAKEAAKAATPAAPSADAAAPAQQAVPGTESVPTIEPGQALQNAIEAVQAALDGGKVTRKVLEGVAPLLAAAKTYQDWLASGVSAAPQTTPKLPPLFKPSEIGLVVEQAKALVTKASNMLAQVIEF